MEGFSPAWAWSALGLGLMLIELVTGAFVMLALGAAALVTALVVTLTGIGLIGQLVTMGLVSGVLVPIVIYKIRPLFSPKGVRYGTTGTGADGGKTYSVEPMGFDQRIHAIKINGDQYRIQVIDAQGNPSHKAIQAGDRVTFVQFDGTTALVRPAD